MIGEGVGKDAALVAAAEAEKITREITQTAEKSLAVIAAKLDSLEALVRETLVPAIADGVTQILQNFSRLDELNITLKAPMKLKGPTE